MARLGYRGRPLSVKLAGSLLSTRNRNVPVLSEIEVSPSLGPALFRKASRTWSGHTEVPLEIVPLENGSVDKSSRVPYNGPADAGESTNDNRSRSTHYWNAWPVRYGSWERLKS
jgi:hypothetical protein